MTATRVHHLLIALGLAIAATVAHAESYKTGNCESDEFRDEAWLQVTAQEPRIMQELNNIGKSSGQGEGPEVKVTNCRIEWPVDGEGRPMEGYRTAVLHHIWYTQLNKDQLRHEGGIRIIWSTRFEKVHVGSSIYLRPLREVLGFTICRSPAVCSVLNVLGLKQTAETPVSLEKQPTPSPSPSPSRLRLTEPRL